MNLNEAKANVGKEVIYIGNDKEVISAFNGKKLIISYPTKNTKTSVLIEYDDLCFWNVDPQYLKLKEQPMKNYKIKVTPETSEEVQRLFFELKYAWSGGNKTTKYKDSLYIHTIDKIITVTNCEETYSDLNATEITIPQLCDFVVLKRNDMGDATHRSLFCDDFYYVGEDVYIFEDGEWKKSVINPKDLNGLLGKIEMTWQDALCALADGKNIDMRFNGEFEPLINLLEAWLYGKEFRIKPQTIHVDGGDYTKKELLKIVGEME